jgi:hypothetical protein
LKGKELQSPKSRKRLFFGLLLSLSLIAGFVTISIPVVSATSSFKFTTGSSVLTKAQKAALKKWVATSGTDAPYLVVGTAGELPGVSNSQVRGLAKKRGQVVKAYLIELGVNPANITTKITVSKYGTVPKFKMVQTYAAETIPNTPNPEPAPPVVPSCAAGGPCAVGDRGPGGGIVFYVSNANFTSIGSTCNTACKYLEAAPAGWAGAEDPLRRWAEEIYRYTIVNNASSPETATASGIGWGYFNTRAIILQGNSDTATIAAALADSYTVTLDGAEVADWFLPSIDELNQMCKWQRGIAWTSDTQVCEGGTINTGPGAAGFASEDYNSSTEYNYGYRMVINFGSDSIGPDGKDTSRRVRPIRAF